MSFVCLLVAPQGNKCVLPRSSFEILSSLSNLGRSHQPLKGYSYPPQAHKAFLQPPSSDLYWEVFIQPWVDEHLCCSIFRLLWIMMLLIFVYKLLSDVFWVLSGKYLGVKLLGRMINLSVFNHRLARLLRVAVWFLHSHRSCVRVPVSPYSCQCLLLSAFEL